MIRDRGDLKVACLTAGNWDVVGTHLCIAQDEAGWAAVALSDGDTARWLRKSGLFDVEFPTMKACLRALQGADALKPAPRSPFRLQLRRSPQGGYVSSCGHWTVRRDPRDPLDWVASYQDREIMSARTLASIATNCAVWQRRSAPTGGHRPIPDVTAHLPLRLPI